VREQAGEAPNEIKIASIAANRYNRTRLELKWPALRLADTPSGPSNATGFYANPKAMSTGILFTGILFIPDERAAPKNSAYQLLNPSERSSLPTTVF
jgi:hypothetical protein